MDCLKCGASIPEENAVYCGECGARLDGKKACPSCGEWIDEKYTYCIYCGARADGKTACRGCGTYFESSFCPNCGTPAQEKKPVSAPVKVKAVQTQKEEKPTTPVWETIFSWIRAAAGLACVCFALIFVFFIGFKLSAQALGMDISGLTTSENKNLWYFFGDVYKDLREFEQAGAFKSTLPSTGLTIYAILGTVLSAATLLGVVGCAIPAIMGFVKFATTRVENNGAKWGVIAALTYIGGVCAMYALDALVIEMSASGESITAALAMDGATKAGTALCIVFLAIYAAGNLVRKGKAWKRGKTIAKVVLTVCAAAFAIVILAVDKCGYVGYKIAENGTAIQYTFAQQYNNVMLVTLAEGVGVAFYNSNTDLIATSFIFSIVQQVALLATVAGAAVLMVKYLFSTEENGKGKMGLSIFLLVCAVVQMVSGIVCQDSMTQLMVNMANSTGSDMIECELLMGAAIVAVVFAVFNLGVQIATKAIEKKETIEYMD